MFVLTLNLGKAVPHYEISWAETDGHTIATPGSDQVWSTTGSSSVNSSQMSQGTPNGTVRALGYFNATFTWNDEGTKQEAPRGIIIQEVATAEWFGETGLATTDMEESYISFPHYGVSFGDRYTFIKDPGETFVRKIYAFAEGVAGSDATKAADVFVGVDITVHPISIVPTQLLRANGTDFNLTGQKLGGKLVCDLFTSSTTYAWSVQSGEPFKDYNHTEPVVSPNFSKVFVTPYVPANETGDETTFYCKRGTLDAKLECMFTDPELDGASGTIPYEAVVVQEPKLVGSSYLKVGDWDIRPGAYNLDWIKLWNVPTGRPSTEAPMAGMFAAGGTDHTSWDKQRGMVGFTQLVKAQVTLFPLGGGPPIVKASVLPNTTSQVFVLDLSPVPIQGPANGKIATFHIDAPGVGLIPEIQKVDIDDVFNTYLMFRPPGDPEKTRWIPVHRFPWVAHGVAERVSGVWQKTDLASASSSQEAFPAFPEWDTSWQILYPSNSPGN